MDFHVSLIGRKNLSAEIYRQLRKAIVDGRLRPGDKLPPTRELARSLGVSRTTVSVAFDRLTGEGFLKSRVGAGTFVNERAARRNREVKRVRTAGVLRPRPVWETISLPTRLAGFAEFDFRTGLPDAALFPFQEWRRLISRQLRQDNGFDRYAGPAGHRGAREAIARHIGVSRGLEVAADDITVTSGTQQAIDLVARAFLNPGDIVAVEDPGYAPPRRLFQSLGLRVQGVPVDREGIVVSVLPRHARLIYVTPSHQYPLGIPMTLPRRLELLAWAEQNNAAILEDDYDTEFRFSGRPIEPLQTLDMAGRVIYVGSFSKTLLPTLRLGFLIAPPSLQEAIHKVKSVTDWHTSLVTQAALAQFIEDGGFARHLRKMSVVYQDRREIILNFLARRMADHLEVLPSAAGIHITAIARTASADHIAAIVSRARADGVAVHELLSFALANPPLPGIVLGYGAVPTARINEGLRRLLKCFTAPEARNG